MSQPEAPPVEWRSAARAVKHQMSNILMGLMGHAELLEEQPELGEESRRKVRQIREQARRLLEQVDALNDLCRAENDG